MIDITSLKSRIDLVEVVTQRGIVLEPRGENLFGLCPFHAEDTPSFCVNPKTQLWKCFGCGEGGDVFTFVQKFDRVDFIGAVKKLCKDDIQEKTLADLNRERQQEENAKAIDRPPQDVLDRIVDHWQKSLSSSAKARAFLRHRGLWHPAILRALNLGYSTGRLSEVLPESGKLVRQLKRMGILNKKGNEFFYQRIVVPVFDENGVLTTIYGRSIDPDANIPHLYLPGPRRGVFNPAGIQDGQDVILTESILDAMALLALGIGNVTASFGTQGFTADLRGMLLRRKVPRVFCAYDTDPAGDHAADQLAHDLAGHGIEVRRIELTAKDPNEFLVCGGTKETFLDLIAKAGPLRVAGDRGGEPGEPGKPAEPADPVRSSFTYGERTYQIEGEPVRSGGALKVTLKVSREDRSFIDTVNLYSDRARSGFIGKLDTTFRGQVSKKALVEDLFALIDALEARVKDDGLETSKSMMTPLEEREAREFLRRPDLIEAILDDLTKLGVVGEADNKLLAYLVTTSRKLSKPLSLSVISRSSAGKSWLLNRVVDLMPEPDVLRYTRMSPRALFYDEPGRFKHKILFIEEAIGAKDADLGVRSMQSEKRLANLATMTDPKTGKLKTQETIVEGPLTYLTSSVEPLDHETATRSFEVTIDESADQTGRIVSSLFYERTLDGIRARMDKDEVIRRHHNAQTLVDPLMVINPYADQLTFPTDTLRLRREADKYLSLIETLALLHQHQRPRQSFTEKGQDHHYILVIRGDIDRANRLMATCLARALADLPGPAQELLLAIRDFVSQKAGTGDLTDVSFNRREIREWTRWSDYQVRLALDHLVDQEYVETVSGSFGRRFVYTLTPDHRLIVQAGLTIEEKIVALGLTPVTNLREPDPDA